MLPPVIILYILIIAPIMVRAEKGVLEAFRPVVQIGDDEFALVVAEASPVAYREIATKERDAVSDWGLVDELYIDGRPVRTGPPPSYEKIRSLIGKRVRRL